MYKVKAESLGKRRELLHNGVWFCNKWDHACRFEKLVKQISVALKFENDIRFYRKIKVLFLTSGFS